MPTIKLDEALVNFIRRVKDNPRLGDGSITGLITNAVRFFLHKHDSCFTCPVHKESLSTIELGRQKLAIVRVNSGAKKSGGDWVVVQDIEHEALSEYAMGYGRTAKQVAEQAVVEHLTRPPQCQSCPYYAEMKERIKDEYGEGTVLSDSAPGFRAEPNQTGKSV